MLYEEAPSDRRPRHRGRQHRRRPRSDANGSRRGQRPRRRPLRPGSSARARSPTRTRSPTALKELFAEQKLSKQRPARDRQPARRRADPAPAGDRGRRTSSRPRSASRPRTTSRCRSTQAVLDWQVVGREHRRGRRGDDGRRRRRRAPRHDLAAGRRRCARPGCGRSGSTSPPSAMIRALAARDADGAAVRTAAMPAYEERDVAEPTAAAAAGPDPGRPLLQPRRRHQPRGRPRQRLPVHPRSRRSASRASPSGSPSAAS